MEDYLGDGVYIRTDAYGGLELTTQNGECVTNTICLEPEVIRKLEEFIDRWRTARHDAERNR